MNCHPATVFLLSIFAIILLGALATATPIYEVPSQPTGDSSVGGSESVDRGTGEEPGNARNILDLFPIILAFLGMLLLGVGYIVYRLRNPPSDRFLSDQSISKTESQLLEQELHDVAGVAGEAATRIQQTEGLENEVYQAWRIMTQKITVSNRQSTTPAEFAEHAISLGMEEEDVRELTELFEEVRYGQINPTTGDEQQAIQLLQRIETKYGDEDT